MKKRILSTLLALCMALALLPTAATEAGAVAAYVNPNSLTYKIEKDNTVTITDCPETATGTLDIPATIEGKPVRKIGSGAFRKCENITIVTIPDGVTEIGSNAFYSCKSMTGISIPSSVQTIGNGAFGYSGLLSATIPEGVTKIDSVFTYCESLVRVTLPNSLTEIQADSFRNCKSLTSITIPPNVTYIGSSGFRGCSALNTITIPASVKTIDYHAFAGCSSLESVTLSEGLETIKGYLFLDCTSLKSITIPTTVKELGWNSFNGCTALTTATINGTFTQLTGQNVFNKCQSMETLIINAPLTTFGDYTMARGCTSLKTLYLPGTLYEIKDNTFQDCPALSDVYFNGTAYDWAGVGIGNNGNDAIRNATMHFIPFKDTQAGSWYYNPMLWAIDKGVTAGTSETSFSPNDTCTQGQILTFLWRAAGSPSASGGNAYTDSAVSPEQYYYIPMQWAYQQGIVTDASLNPSSPCTRADVVTYLWRLANQPSGGSASSFTDVSASAGYAQAVAWAVMQGITSGTSATTFSPDAICTRAQIVTFLYNALA